jgi:hypothetical protein
VGEIHHDQTRHRALWEDLSLPLPHQIHMLGQRAHKPSSSLSGEFDYASRRNRFHESTTGGMRGHRRMDQMKSLLTPLFQGYGTHFSYIYVGTPPQRQSVIVDTGSHYTAFPCTGCAQCGQHTDKYWDLSNSSTADIQKCGKDNCNFGQSYSEGSSWRAFKVVDKLWVGGLTQSALHGEQYAINFMFGCQTSETGLFRTQLADGIMGMAMAQDTLPYAMVEQGAASANIFAMCFRIGGGILTLGGVDQRIHTRPTINYASIRRTEGWFTVELLDIQLIKAASNQKESLGVDPKYYNSGKGPIVDSGTTDTYLPLAIANQFKTVFKKLSGVSFSNANIPLTDHQLVNMPDVNFVLKGEDGQPFDLIMPWTSYIDKVGENKFAFRIYLTEGSGAVLGANFMDGYNVIFDHDNKRVGFAKSDCKYEDFMPKMTLPPTPAPTHRPTFQNRDGSNADSGNDCVSEMVAITKCSARCTGSPSGNTPYYFKDGKQKSIDKCDRSESPQITEKDCNQPCYDRKIVRGQPKCYEKGWGECLHSCIQSRQVPDYDVLDKENKCTYHQQTRNCYSGACPLHDGDMIVFIDMRIMVDPQEWSYVHSEIFYASFAKMFDVRVEAIELLNDASSEYSFGAKLHFQIRLKSRDYKDKTAMIKAAESIPQKVWKPQFKQDLLNAIEAESHRVEKIDFSRFGYLTVHDVEILNAAALPLGDVRDPVDIPNSSGAAITQISDVLKNRTEYLLFGVTLGCLLCLCCMAGMYIKLHKENLALAKDKIDSTSIMKLYKKFQAWRKSQNIEFDEDGNEYSQIEMQQYMDATMHDDEDEGYTKSPVHNNSIATGGVGDEVIDNVDDNDL